MNVEGYANGGSICNVYTRGPYEEGKKIKKDKVCISPDDKSFYSHWRAQDKLEFNGQVRGLGLMQGQGYEEEGMGFAKSMVCPAICDEW